MHNTETQQSLWKFPQDVMLAVIEMDRVEWEAKKKRVSEPKETTEPDEAQSENRGPQSTATQEQARLDDYDNDSYEEIEVTDDEAEEGEDIGPSKRARISHHDVTPSPTGPIEFNEDDIAWQLAQMESEYSDHDLDPEIQDDDEDEGLPLTESDDLASFCSLLDDSGISPYSTFEKLIEDTSVVEDRRYTALPNVSARKTAFSQWSRDRISELQAFKQAETQKRKIDPKVEYLRFLQKHATTKLYWPEFKRKYRKDSEMRDSGIQDKDREKTYREFVAKLRMGEADRRKELVTLLKATSKVEMKRGMGPEELPDAVLRDLRFYVVDEHRRDELVNTFLQTL